VPGNSMAGRMASLLDPATGRATEGAIEVVDPATVALHLPRPDITLIAGMADYPAAIVHASYDPGDTRNAIGTGPYRIEEMEVGARAVLTRIPGRDWWGTAIHGGPYLERIEFLDHGPDPAAWVGAAEAGEIDMVYETVGDYVEIMDTIGWTRSEVDSAATVCIRPNQRAEIEGRRPYADARVRKALQLAVNNSILQWGAEVDSLLEECQKRQEQDPRLELKLYDDLKNGGTTVRAFYVRYLLPIWFDIQCIEYAADSEPARKWTFG